MNVLWQIKKLLGNLNGTDQKQSYNIPPVKNKFYEWTKEANLKCYIVPHMACQCFCSLNLYLAYLLSCEDKSSMNYINFTWQAYKQYNLWTNLSRKQLTSLYERWTCKVWSSCQNALHKTPHSITHCSRRVIKQYRKISCSHPKFPWSMQGTFDNGGKFLKHAKIFQGSTTITLILLLLC